MLPDVHAAARLGRIALPVLVDLLSHQLFSCLHQVRILHGSHPLRFCARNSRPEVSNTKLVINRSLKSTTTTTSRSRSIKHKVTVHLTFLLVVFLLQLSAVG